MDAPMSESNIINPIINGGPIPTSTDIDPVAEAKKAPVAGEPVYKNVTITPAEAKRLLGHLHPNRRLMKANVNYLAGAITRGEWTLNGEGIAFSPKGDILNGQHRLEACVLSGESIRTMVAFNVDPDSVYTMDTGKVRTLGEVLYARNDERDLSSPIKFLWDVRLEQDCAAKKVTLPNPRIKPTTIQLLDLYESESTLKDSLKDTRTAVRGSLAGISGPAVHVAHYLTTQEDAVNASSFWDGIVTGAGLATTDVRYQFREWHHKKMATTATANRPTKAHYFIALMRAWKLYLAGKPAHNKTWTYQPSKGLLAF